MTTTPNLGMTFIVSGQSQAEVPHNEALLELDALSMPMVKDRDLTAPPGSPSSGDRYIPKATATGLWVGKEGKIAYWYVNQWRFFTPKVGWSAWVEDEKVLVRWDGTSWKTLLSPAMFGAKRITSVQALTGTFAGVNWNSQDRYDNGVYTHSTSTNPDQITLKEAGDYVVGAEVSIDGTSGTSHCEVRLSINGTSVAGTVSYGSVVSAGTPDKITVATSRIVSVSPNDILRVEAKIASGGGAADVLNDASRVTVRRM